MESVVNYQNLHKYYNGKKVLVTGHTGFKGAWLSALLFTLGARVKGYALEPEYENGLFNLLLPYQVCESVIADIRDKSRLDQEITTFKPDFIFHLAAQPLVRRSYSIPAETFDINVVGTANLLEALRNKAQPCSVVIITSDKVYENREQDILYTEHDRLGGFDPYSASKACTELVVSSFRSSFFPASKFSNHKKSLASARAGNVIGGGDWNTDRIIPDIVRYLKNEQAISLRNPLSVRPWQHVLEPLGGYLLLAARMQEQPQQYSRAYNFGPYPQDHLQVKELVEIALKIWGNGSWKDISDPLQPHEARLLKLDITRSITDLQWKPKLNSTNAIDWTIKWYQQPINRQADFTFEQIKKYLAL
jgi:CDP-glucose 4,6-dehydratase